LGEDSLTFSWKSICAFGTQFYIPSFHFWRKLTLLVPGVDSSRVPGFFREFMFFLDFMLLWQN
jgi:hypothetical protein